MKMQTLQELYIHELKDLCDAERQLIEALPKMRDGAESQELQDAFTKHLEETEGHFENVKELLKGYGEVVRVKCKGMEGLIEEGKKALRDAESPVKDAALISAAQRVEHYEIAGYGTVRSHAEQLGDDRAVQLLSEILEEESAANETLNDIALNQSNKEAVRKPRRSAKKKSNSRQR